MTVPILPAPRALITADEAITTLREVVAEAGPDYRYGRPPAREYGGYAGVICLYVHQGQPSCGVARVLHRLGVPMELLAHYEGLSAIQLGDRRAGHAGNMRNLPLLLTPEAAKILDAFQWEQDQSNTWGNALEVAERVYAEITTEVTK